MNAIWTLLNSRAVAIDVAGGQLNFGISWLGIILVVAGLFLWRRLRR